MKSEDGNVRKRTGLTETHTHTATEHGSEPEHEGTDTETPETDKPYFEFEKLDVYKVAEEFSNLAAHLVPARGHAVLRDQLERASTAITFNIAEGACKLTFRDKRKFYDTARGSAGECGSILYALLQRHVISAEDYQKGRALLLRILQMLTKLGNSAKWKDRS